MQLSKLEIKGFKSFGDQAIISFDEGVTGIVGPNGCGKSNVVDSIRWVLGEQKTRSLRSDKMENIIFNGTKNRKAAQVAQVSLTFHNNQQILPSEYSYVTITRRYHRSGESEYLINEVRCRLKDINNLFLDTGIGSDSYAIIELKKVDEILSDKDNSRRDLFEKAAGISKYKVRKKESLSRLDAVDKDLARVGDLLFEIEKNLKSLERQAKQAERYFKLKKLYKDSSLWYAQKSISRQKELFQTLRQQIEEATHKKQNLQELLLQKEHSIDTEKEKLEHFEKAVSHRQKQLNEHKAKIRNTENEKKLKNERLSFLTEKNNTLRRQIAEDIENQRTLREEIQRIQQEKENTEKLFLELESSLDSLKEDYEIQKEKTEELQHRLRVNEELYQGKQTMIYQLRKEYEVKQMQLSSIRQELEQIAGRDYTQKEALAVYDKDMEETRQALGIARKELESFQEKEERRGVEMQELEEQVEELRQALQEAQRSLDAKTHEYTLTKSWLDTMEGFPEALQYLQKDTDWAENIPLVSDILSCEEKYRTAVESFLDPWLNYYVVMTEEEAYEAIHLLKKANKGKANFFIISKLKKEIKPSSTFTKKKLNPETSMFFGGLSSAQLPQKATEEPVPALEILHYEEAYESLIHYLFADLLIVPDKNTAKSKNKPLQHFVTLQGDVVQRKFNLTGGSVGASEGKRIGQVKRLESLEFEIEDLRGLTTEQKETFTFKKANLQSLKNNKSLQEGIREHQKRVNQVNEKYITLKSKKEQLSGIIQTNASRQGEIQEKLTQVQEALVTVQPQVESEQKELEGLKEQLGYLREELTFENEALAMKSARFNEKNILFHRQQNQMGSYERELEYKTQSVETIRERIQQHEKELKELENNLEALLETRENFEEVLLELGARTEEYETRVQNVEKDYYTLRGQIGDAEKETREIQRQRELNDSLLSQLQNKMHDTKLSLTSLRERLSVEFQVNLDELMQTPMEAPEEGEEEMTEEALKEKVEALRQKIDKMGNINPMAMESFQEMQERHQFIAGQKNDLEESKNSLLKTMEEMETYACNAFMEAYEQIRTNFIKVFRSLFSAEDNADLRLSNPDNPLDSKIDIIAQPKGKRPLTIDQLSGGEKTLTATSLLFALYLLKPAPFCIFDEVDAPLDDTNTDKFNKIIKEFSKDSQFIIVTHNKRTMSSADVLYGVTMIQDGVSSVVPVDLRNIEKEAMKL